METLNKIWAWLKKNIWYVLSGFGIILVALLALDHEKKKVAKLKGQVVIARNEEKLKSLKETREKLEKYSDELETKDNELDKEIANKETEIKEMKKKVEDMSDDKVIEEFNKMYNSP